LGPIIVGGREFLGETSLKTVGVDAGRIRMKIVGKNL